MQIHNDEQKKEAFENLGRCKRLISSYVIALRNFILPKFPTRRRYWESVQNKVDREAFLRQRLGEKYDVVCEETKGRLWREVLEALYKRANAPKKSTNAAEVNIHSSPL